MAWSFYYINFTCICLHMRIRSFCSILFPFYYTWNMFPFAQILWWPELFKYKLACFCLRMRIDAFFLCSDTVMGWSFYNIHFTCICLHMRINASSLLLRYRDGLSFCYIYCTHICLRMRTDACSLCSDTEMGWSWCYADWTRICLRMRMMLFTHEIFFSVRVYGYMAYISHYSLDMVTRFCSTLYSQWQYLNYTIQRCAYSSNVWSSPMITA